MIISSYLSGFAIVSGIASFIWFLFLGEWKFAIAVPIATIGLGWILNGVEFVFSLARIKFVMALYSIIASLVIFFWVFLMLSKSSNVYASALAAFCISCFQFISNPDAQLTQEPQEADGTTRSALRFQKSLIIGQVVSFVSFVIVIFHNLAK